MSRRSRALLVIALCLLLLDEGVGLAQVQSTPTPSATPSATPTLGDLNHFMCYEVRRREPRFDTVAGVSLEDQFGPGEVTVRYRKRICNPADKNGEDPTAPTDDEHLMAYEIRQRDPRFQAIRDVRAVNQLGDITFDVVRPDRIMVPTAKDLVAPPPPLVNPSVDHFKCYRIRHARTRVDGLNVTDQFGDLVVNVKRPLRFCVPADKNMEGINDPASHLMCYKVKTVPRRLMAGATLNIVNQLEDTPIVLTGPRELCVPSLKFLPGDPTPTPTATPDNSCGFFNEQGGGERTVGVCGGVCPPEEICVFEPTAGMCGCVPETEGCQIMPPDTAPGNGICLGLCPGSLDVCVPGKGDCFCAPVQPTPEPTPEPTPTMIPCNIEEQPGGPRGEPSLQFQCALFSCPPDLTCVYDPALGNCRCADSIELCQEQPPGTTSGGVCGGLCPNSFDSCLPGFKVSCECVD